MKTNGNDKALESYRIFPYVAWILTIGFAIFAYTVTLQLKAEIEELKVQTQYLQEKVHTPVEKIEDFES
ncbi:hypothetical protein KC906_02325 [Candidatus Kaiserbacteria bacterium]|nr:hypothetical protein [Candidatus Kaiserbacteria bacterium]MCB9812568.1 hypothetical protein [Candidatus Nomurabacteria bacterium]